MAMPKTACERFCKAGEADSTTRARQNNKMMNMAVFGKFTFINSESAIAYLQK